MPTKLNKFSGECFKRPWPPLIKMDDAVRKKIDTLICVSKIVTT
jgi:hypothetical protein